MGFDYKLSGHTLGPTSLENGGTIVHCFLLSCLLLSPYLLEKKSDTVECTCIVVACSGYYDMFLHQCINANCIRSVQTCAFRHVTTIVTHTNSCNYIHLSY